MSGRPHVLIIREVGEPYAPLSTHDWADWELEHFDDCPMIMLGEDDAGMPFEAYGCAEGRLADAIGVRWSLRYSGCPVEEPGRYLVETWSEVQRGYGWTEYDEGFCLVEHSGRRGVMRTCTMCGAAPATTTWCFPVCGPCADWLANIDEILTAEEAANPELTELRRRIDDLVGGGEG